MRERRMSEKRSSTGQRDALLLEVVRELEEIEPALPVGVGPHDDVAVVVDVEVARAPALML